MTASIPKVSPFNRHTLLPNWKPAPWEDYVCLRDQPGNERVRLFWHRGYLFVDDMGEGINHSGFSDLFTMLFAFWFAQIPGQVFSSLGRCQMEKAPLQAAAPDLVLYLGENYPRWQAGEPRYLNLHQWQVPDLAGEISDTSLATDLDEKKKLYADMGVPEYWVVNVQGKQVFAFQLQPDGSYQQIEQSLVLKGLPIALLEQTLGQLEQGTNGSAALWFSGQIAQLNLGKEDLPANESNS